MEEPTGRDNISGDILNYVISPKIKNLCVLEEVVSLKCSHRRKNNGLFDFLQEALNKDYLLEAKVESSADSSLFTFWNCKIRSINIQEEIHFVIHFIPVDLNKTQKLLQIIQSGRLRIIIIRFFDSNKNLRLNKSAKSSKGKKKIKKQNFTINDEKIDSLLVQVSNQTGKPKEVILNELTSFVTKDGRLVQGKSSLKDISNKQKVVLISKLKKQLRGSIKV